MYVMWWGQADSMLCMPTFPCTDKSIWYCRCLYPLKMELPFGKLRHSSSEIRQLSTGQVFKLPGAMGILAVITDALNITDKWKYQTSKSAGDQRCLWLQHRARFSHPCAAELQRWQGSLILSSLNKLVWAGTGEVGKGWMAGPPPSLAYLQHWQAHNKPLL